MVLQKIKINNYYWKEFVTNFVILPGNVDIYGITQILLL